MACLSLVPGNRGEDQKREREKEGKQHQRAAAAHQITTSLFELFAHDAHCLRRDLPAVLLQIWIPWSSLAGLESFAFFLGEEIRAANASHWHQQFSSHVVRYRVGLQIKELRRLSGT